VQPLALDSIPRLRLAPPPELPAGVADVVEVERAKLNEHPYHFDGPQLIATTVSPQEFVCYQGSYAHYRAFREVGLDTPLGVGCVGIGLLLFFEEQELWVRRSAHVDQPGSWCFAVAGGVTDARDGLVGTVLKEVEEELGVKPRDVINLSPLALLKDEGGYVLWQARLRAGTILNPNPAEVAETRWVEDWRELEPVHPHIAALRQAAYSTLA
jgi:8-oxo-dGTP pyrophosphatase MutT (NUDIX family)